MKKIECRIYEYRMVMGEKKSRWCFCRENEALDMIAYPDVGLKGAVYEVRQLWTGDAMQAVAEAVLDACEYSTGMRFSVDIAAIINQLKGE